MLLFDRCFQFQAFVSSIWGNKFWLSESFWETTTWLEVDQFSLATEAAYFESAAADIGFDEEFETQVWPHVIRSDLRALPDPMWKSLFGSPLNGRHPEHSYYQVFNVELANEINRLDRNLCICQSMDSNVSTLESYITGLLRYNMFRLKLNAWRHLWITLVKKHIRFGS